jgi:hypothetical protein
MPSAKRLRILARVTLCSGKSRVAFPANLNLSTLNGTNGFTIIGAVNDTSEKFSEQSGRCQRRWIDDVIVGAPHASPNGAFSGASYVVFGKATFGATFSVTQIDGGNGFQISGATASGISWEVGQRRRRR